MKTDRPVLIAALIVALAGCSGNSPAGQRNELPPNQEPQPLPDPPNPDPPDPPDVPPIVGEGYAPPVLGPTCEAGAARGASRGGLWYASLDNSGEMRLLVAETGEFRWISPWGWDQQIVGSFQSVDEVLTSEDAVWAWVNGLTWLETEQVGLTLHGELDEESNLRLDIELDKDPEVQGTMDFTACNSVYTRGSSLATIAGDYANDYSILSIDPQGLIYYQARTCVGTGELELIDPQFNLYRMALEVTSCSGNEVYTTDRFTGLAYLTDSGAGHTGDVLEYSLTAGTDEYALFWTNTVQK